MDDPRFGRFAEIIEMADAEANFHDSAVTAEFLLLALMQSDDDLITPVFGTVKEQAIADLRQQAISTVVPRDSWFKKETAASVVGLSGGVIITRALNRWLMHATNRARSSGHKCVEAEDVLYEMAYRRDSALLAFLMASKMTPDGLEAAITTAVKNGELKRELGVLVEPLSLQLSAGRASAEELAELFVAVDSLYRLAGGSGVTFELVESPEPGPARVLA